MPMVFKGDLTRHIHKCYPKGKAVDREPVPNELSMLIFYLQTRPAKIPKAANVLGTRALGFSTNSNSGSFNVTVRIMHEMIRKLHDHLTLFAEGALSIIDLTLEKGGNDPSFLELSRDMFEDFNRYHQGVLFAGNASFTQHFLNVVNKYVAIAQKGTPSYRVPAINALASLAESPALATRVGQKSVIAAVAGFEANIPRDPAVYQEVTDTTRGTYPSSQRGNVAFFATLGLRELLDTSSLDQITGIVQTVLRWQSSSNGEWQPRLVAYMAKWVPPQNRFVVTKTVVATMSALSTDNIKQMANCSSYLDALLLSEESKMGLSVVDVLRQLLRLQHRLIETPPGSADHQSIQNLLVLLRRNIGHLVNTNIYPGQASDMMAEILQKYSSPPGSAGRPNAVHSIQSESDSARPGPTSLSSQASPKSSGIIVNDFKVLLEILESISTHGHDQRKISTTQWEGTQWVLSSRQPQVLVLYATTFGKYLELAQTQASATTRRGSLLVRQLCELAQQELELMNYVSLYYSLLSLVQFHAASAPALLPWVLSIIPSSDPKDAFLSAPVKISRASVGLALVLAICRIASIEPAGNEVFALIGERVANTLWLPGITYPPAVTVEVAVASLSNGNTVTFGELGEDGPGAVTEQSTLRLLDVQSSDRISAEDKKFILEPPFALDAPAESDEARLAKLRAAAEPQESAARHSISSNSRTSSLVGSQAPKVDDLRRRQTDLQSLQVHKNTVFSKRISLPPKQKGAVQGGLSNADLINILDTVSLHADTRGNLTL